MPAPVLVVQATMQRVESEDDHTRVLVPYIPPDTDIALTTLEDLYDKVKDTPAWLKRSLRNDLMLMAHELNFHAVPRNMVKQLRQLVMWPSLIADCKNHVGACRKCLQALKLLRSVGVSLQELGRFRKTFMDVWHFPQSVKKRTGHMGCLTMCDAAGGLTRYIAIKTESAEACAMVIITHWIAVFGLMEELWSDNASAFAGEVMELICNMLGVKKKFAAVGDSRKVGMAETRHNSVKTVVVRPVGTLRVQRTLPRLHKVDVDQFVIYEEEDRSFAGKVTSSAEDKFVVHDWGPHEKQRDKFLPLWLMEGSAEAQRGPLEQPTGARPHLTAVPQTHLILVGELDEKTNRLTQLTRDALSARGIDL